MVLEMSANLTLSGLVAAFGAYFFYTQAGRLPLPPEKRCPHFGRTLRPFFKRTCRVRLQQGRFSLSSSVPADSSLVVGRPLWAAYF